MLISLLSWWYSKGLAWKSGQILDGLEKSINTFSLGLLVRTWFAPFRQIDAGEMSYGGLDYRFRRSLDKLISRFIGALLRASVMFAGVIFISIKAIYGFLVLIFWILAPILPIVFVVIFATGWTPNIISKIKVDFSRGDALKVKQNNDYKNYNLFKFGGF